jgi:hypothetical protein
MNRLMAGVPIAAFIFAFCAASLAQAPSGTPARVRGTVESVQGNTVIVKARNGESMTVRLADDYTVIGIAKASVADVTSGKFIGTTTVGERNGALVAQEIHIFPESMRGTGEGHRDHDLPASKMTNASVADIKAVGPDRIMTVTYKGGEKKVLIPDNAIVVAYVPAEKSELKPGAPVYINAQRAADGSLTAPRVNVGLRGQIPPM